MSRVGIVRPRAAVHPLQESSTRLVILAGLLLACLLLPGLASAQAVGTAFTYQGELRLAGEAVNGAQDFEFRLFDSAQDGGQIGPTVARSGIVVQEGLFSAELDFGPGQFAGDAQWLQVAVRAAGGGAFQPLLPRTRLTATPYAQAALTALDGSVTSASIASGAVGTSQINATQVQRRVSGSCPEGQYLRAVAQNGTVTCGSDATGNDWSRGGNAGTDASVDFLGTTDAQALELRTGNARSLRIEPSSVVLEGLPVTASVIAGSHANVVDAGVIGASIGGGGSSQASPANGANRVGGHYGTVAGGWGNWIGGDPPNPAEDDYSTIGGGIQNRATGEASTVAGGRVNLAAIGSAVAGGLGNQAVGGFSSVGGGQVNLSTGNFAVVAGGNQNRAAGNTSAALAGERNYASGQWSTIAGGFGNCAGGDYSWAGGRQAGVRTGDQAGVQPCFGLPNSGDTDGDNGTFVWADSQNTAFVSTGPNQFLVRASGGVALNDNVVPALIDLLVTSRGSGENADLMLRAKGSDTVINFGASASGGLFVARADISDLATTSFTNYAQWTSSGQFRLFVDNPLKPTAGGFAAPSDQRLKQDIRPLGDVLDQLLSLRGVRFAYRDDAPDGLHAPGPQVGFIAQEVETVFPDWVTEHESGYKLVAPKGFDALAVEALRELRDEMDAQIAALQAQLQSALARLAALEDARQREEPIHAR